MVRSWRGDASCRARSDCISPKGCSRTRAGERSRGGAARSCRARSPSLISTNIARSGVESSASALWRAGRRCCLADARFARRFPARAAMHELVRALEAQRFASSGLRRVELLHREINLDGIAAARENVGEAYDVSGTTSRAEWRLSGRGNRRLACTMNDAALAEPGPDWSWQSSVFRHAAGARQYASIEQQREGGVVQLECRAERRLVDGNAHVRRQ